MDLRVVTQSWLDAGKHYRDRRATACAQTPLIARAKLHQQQNFMIVRRKQQIQLNCLVCESIYK